MNQLSVGIPRRAARQSLRRGSETFPLRLILPGAFTAAGRWGLLCPSTASLSVPRAEYSNFLFVSV